METAFIALLLLGDDDTFNAVSLEQREKIRRRDGDINVA
jgi:hypothetical protein